MIAFPSALSILSWNLGLESGLFLSTVRLFSYLTTYRLCLNDHCYSLPSLTSVPLIEKTEGVKIIYKCLKHFLLSLFQGQFFLKIFFLIFIPFRFSLPDNLTWFMALGYVSPPFVYRESLFKSLTSFLWKYEYMLISLNKTEIYMIKIKSPTSSFNSISQRLAADVRLTHIFFQWAREQPTMS